MAITRDITVIGASAGGIAALRALLKALPADYPAAIFVVLHLAPESPPVLAGILDRSTRLTVRIARTGEPVTRGVVVVAPPDHHLILERGHVVLSHGPRENRHRPSIDVLFRSAAVAYGPRVTGVILTGMLDDGAAGLWAVKQRGGVAVVQDPDDAEYPDMPRNALEAVRADHRLPLATIPRQLQAIAREMVTEPLDAVPHGMAEEVRMASHESTHIETLDAIGKRVPFTCPECGGSLWEFEDAPTQRFRCHVGHAYSIHTLVDEQASRVEAALWAALRSLEENERLARRMAAEADRRGSTPSATAFGETAAATAQHAEVLRGLWADAMDRPRRPAPVPSIDLESQK
jgi:two-component system chemotaxis response regulator CheB